MAEQGSRQETLRRRRPRGRFFAGDMLVLALCAVLIAALLGERGSGHSSGDGKWFGVTLSVHAPSLHLYLEFSA